MRREAKLEKPMSNAAPMRPLTRETVINIIETTADEADRCPDGPGIYFFRANARAGVRGCPLRTLLQRQLPGTRVDVKLSDDCLIVTVRRLEGQRLRILAEKVLPESQYAQLVAVIRGFKLGKRDDLRTDRGAIVRRILNRLLRSTPASTSGE